MIKRRNKELKRQQSPITKIMAFACYEYQHDQNSDWSLFRDHNMCNPNGSDSHCTLYPPETPSCEFVAIKDRLHAFFPSLLHSGWRAHCIKLKAESEPPSFHSSFDRELWSSCRVIFKYMDSIDDFGIFTTISDILRVSHENSYSSVLFLQNTEIQASKMIRTLHLLMEEIDDYNDTRPISWLLQIVQKNLSLKNSDKMSLIAMFGGELERSVTEAEDCPSTIETKTTISLDCIRKEIKPLSDVFDNCLILMEASRASCVVEVGSIGILFQNVPHDLAFQFHDILQAQPNLAKSIQEIIATKSNLFEYPHRLEFLASCVDGDEYPPAPTKQSECATLGTVFSVEPFDLERGKSICRNIDRCVVYFKDKVWHCKQRVIILCLTPGNSIDIAAIYTRNRDDVPQEWIEKMLSDISQSTFFRSCNLTNYDLRSPRSYFFWVTTFSSTLNFHKNVEDIVQSCLKQQQIKILGSEILGSGFLDLRK